MSDNIYAVTDVLWSREIAGETSFTPVERVLLDVALVEAEVNNGGFHQYFFNSAGDRAAPAIASLEAIGAATTAAILREAVSRFPASAPSADRSTRQKQLHQIAPNTDEFDDLNDRFLAYDDRLDELMVAYRHGHGGG